MIFRLGKQEINEMLEVLLHGEEVHSRVLTAAALNRLKMKDF